MMMESDKLSFPDIHNKFYLEDIIDMGYEVHIRRNDE